jgi:striatin 1/3/4
MFERPKEPEASTNTSGLPNGSGSSQPTKPPSPTSDANRLQSLAADSSKPPSSPLVHTRALPESDEAPVDMTYPEQSKQLLTAIYRPESKSAWRQELKSANDKAEQVSLL